MKLQVIILLAVIFGVSAASAMSGDEGVRRGRTEVIRCGYMSRKMKYLKTGRNGHTENNLYVQQNFWGKGQSAHTRFPVHLAEWEKFRENVKTRTPEEGGKGRIKKVKGVSMNEVLSRQNAVMKNRTRFTGTSPRAGEMKAPAGVPLTRER